MEIRKEKIVYRRATADDIPALIDYRVRFLRELHDHPDDDETKILRNSLLEYFTKAIPANDFVGWVADYEGKIIGTSGMVVWQIPARYGVENGRLGYLLNFYTIPEARRKGIGTRLLIELIREAESIELKTLHLHATEDGINIYRKAGFVEPEQPELVLKLKHPP
ncbi:MAG: GNAT family N-acetyltransferase [Candidatus Bathyarchaeota archaeon]|nr:MAG: GNAT family N-acetyltransferase [Candidatus Bathyarchaeota archaeon]